MLATFVIDAAAVEIPCEDEAILEAMLCVDAPFASLIELAAGIDAVWGLVESWVFAITVDSGVV